jgi:hypothetical protein
VQRRGRHPCKPRGVSVLRQFTLFARVADSLLERTIEIVQGVAQQLACVRVHGGLGQRRADQKAAARTAIGRQVQ